MDPSEKSTAPNIIIVDSVEYKLTNKKNAWCDECDACEDDNYCVIRMDKRQCQIGRIYKKI